VPGPPGPLTAPPPPARGGPGGRGSWALRDTAGFCKLYADPGAGTLLGAHIMGDQAAILIQPLIQAAVAGQRLADLARNQYWIHPALTEVVENVLLKLGLD